MIISKLRIGALQIVFQLIAGLSVFPQTTSGCINYFPHQADQWVFGDRAYLNFSKLPPSADPTVKNFDMPNGIAGISDENGDLLFFTNGIKVWSNDFYLMKDGDALKGNNHATQSALIVPFPGDINKYYIFTVDMYDPPKFSDGVNYSIVDFTNSKQGEVTSKNIFLFGENAQKITGVQHANGKDFWVITKGFGENEFRNFDAWLVTEEGVVDKSGTNIGSPHRGSVNNSSGYMKTSHDGKRLALVIPEDGIVEVFDFNTSSGFLSNAIPAVSKPGMFYYPFGLEFSPDDSKLYFTTSPPGNDTTKLYQLDLQAEDPFTDPFVVHQFVIDEKGGADSIMGALQLAVDGKIYVAKFRRGLAGKQQLAVIHNPDRTGAACNFNYVDGENKSGFDLNGGESLIGLPNFVSSFLDIPHFTYANKCFGDTTSFQITNTTNIDLAEWEFNNDGGDQVIYDPLNPGFVFSEPDDYQVVLTEIFDGVEYQYSETINILHLPFVDLGNGSDTIFMLPGSSVRLDAGVHNTYHWQPGGSTDRFLTATEVGFYIVTVSDSSCCEATDGVYIATAEVYYPTAFQPGSSISINSEFKLIGRVNSFDGYDYSLRIFNRWGQMLFETSEPAKAWDGNWNGNAMPAGTYVWSSVIRSSGNNSESNYEMKQKGTVTLIR